MLTHSETSIVPLEPSIVERIVRAVNAGALSTADTRLRAVVRATYGASDPVGDGNSKTATYGTYRPVGATCPPTCPALASGVCYALHKHVGMAQRRATTEILVAVANAIGAIALGRRTGDPIRLHVSGDFGATPETALEYGHALADAIVEYRAHSGDDREFLAWGYTHWTPYDVEVVVDRLRALGVVFRYSDDVSGRADVALMGERDRVSAETLAAVKALVDTGKASRCPAQTGEVTCVECGLCWKRVDVAIVFAEHD